MKVYETVFLARQELSQQHVVDLTAQFGKIITDMGGKILKTEQWGLRTLAYRINKSKKAHYALMEFEAPAPALHEMERQMRLHDDVMRYMSVKLEAATTEPSPMMRPYDNKSDMKEAA
ncbi:MAG: 30S ribosomal protein S6 [Rhodospirillales bacterium]|nr:30S ribosomal protein S6 [Rhodospirillales bacterium]